MKEDLFFKLIEEIGGKNSIEIVKLLLEQDNYNEFKIADKIKLNINQVRNILYKLYAFNLVSFIRKKDKRKGWYIYFWTLDKLKILELLLKKKRKEVEQQYYLLKSREQKNFFVCSDCDIELTEENALEHHFVCQECGGLLRLREGKNKVAEISQYMEKLKKEFHSIQREIQALKEERERKRIKKEKRAKGKVKRGKAKRKKEEKKLKKKKRR